MTMQHRRRSGEDQPNEPSNSPLDEAALASAAVLFRGFGDVSRLAILAHLMLGEHRVRDLTEHLGLAQSTVSEHLRCLLDCGLVQVRPQGRSSVYSLAAEAGIRDVLVAAEGLLAATGSAVLLCPRREDGRVAVSASEVVAT
jgi:DNA-binding transcriptional ArsR family regulator